MGFVVDVQPRPQPIDESESALEADLEFDLPDVPRDAERIPASELEAD